MTEKNETKTEKFNQNEMDTRLRFDAFTGGVKNGGLRSVTSINLIVSYIVANLSNKVTAEVIVQAMSEGELANHFEVTNAISKLLKGGTIIENEDKTLRITDNTNASIDLIEKDLPYTVRTSSIHLCQKIMAKEKFRRENKVEINPAGNGYQVVMHINDNDTEFMTLSLHAVSIEQAELIKEKFISNPTSVYENLIEYIFANEE